MPKRLTVLALLACTTPGWEAVAHEPFDDRALLQSVSSLLEDGRGLFSADELRVLKAALDASSPAAIDGFLAQKAHIEISINPEGRVAAARKAAEAPNMRCRSSTPWLVRVLNTGFVTAPLTVRLIEEGNVTRGASKSLDATLLGSKLSGATVEYRVLRMTLDAPSLLDATLVFAAGPLSSDLGARAELPLLLNCR